MTGPAEGIPGARIGAFAVLEERLATCFRAAESVASAHAEGN